MSKKRKADSAELDMERTLYSSFVTAANAVSQLYAQGVQQQRRSASTASRTMLVRGRRAAWRALWPRLQGWAEGGWQDQREVELAAASPRMVLHPGPCAHTRRRRC